MEKGSPAPSVNQTKVHFAVPFSKSSNLCINIEYSKRKENLICFVPQELIKSLSNLTSEDLGIEDLNLALNLSTR